MHNKTLILEGLLQCHEGSQNRVGGDALASGREGGFAELDKPGIPPRFGDRNASSLRRREGPRRMSRKLEVEFTGFGARLGGVLVVFSEEGAKLGALTRKALAPTGDLIKKA